MPAAILKFKKLFSSGAPAASGAVWGSITGTLSNQIDLQTALDVKLAGSGTLNYIPKFTPNGTTLGNSIIFDDGTNVGISTTSPTARLHAKGVDATSSNYVAKFVDSALSNLLYCSITECRI